jgi:hypothetical protein
MFVNEGPRYKSQVMCVVDGINRNGDIYFLEICLLFFLTSYLHVDSLIDMVNNHFSHLWGLLQQCHYLGATDVTTPKLWICAYSLTVSTHISAWSS